MYHRYGKDIVPILEKNNPNLKATRSLSIDYKTLKDYIAFIDQEAAAANDTKISGLRIYFAKYEDSKNDGRATVFLNPIMEAGAIGDLRDDVSFAIKTENGKSTAVPVGKLIKKPTTGSNRADLTMPIQNGVQSLAANDFPWSPPPNSDPDDYQ